MAPRSKALETLAQLETSGAPIDAQVEAAAAFLGADITRFEPRETSFHAREEWVLRWLLRRWSAGVEIRTNELSWRLFSGVIRSMPLASVANILNDRKFISILRQTLDDAAALGSTKKRKRDGDSGGFVPLVTAILHAMRFLTKTAQRASDIETEYSAFYMNAAIRTSAEEAAKILAVWLSVCRSMLRKGPLDDWITPFIHVWNSHVVSATDMFTFSMNCLTELLSLLSDLDAVTFPSWKSTLERLLAQQIMLPTKGTDAALQGVVDSLDISKNPRFAPILFGVAIRCLEVATDRRRRPDDETKWLQDVFVALQRDISVDMTLQLLKMAHKYHVVLDISVLRSVVVQPVNWDLTAAILKLDPNVYLIEDESKLLSNLLQSISHSWNRAHVDDVLVPLMVEMAKSRNLAGFMRYWHAGLLASDLQNSEFSAWEDEALQLTLPALLEESLTSQQISGLLDWIEDASRPQALVLLDALAGSLSQEENIDTFGPRILQLLDVKVSSGHRPRYGWRKWRAIRKIVECSETEPEDIFSNCIKHFRKKRHFDELEAAEAFQCACATWSLTFSELLPDSLLQILTNLGQFIAVTDFTPSNPLTSITITPSEALAAYLRCLLLDHPDILILIENIWKVCFAAAETGQVPLLWLTFLEDDVVLREPKILGRIISAMLASMRGSESTAGVQFVTNCLARPPVEIFSRGQREAILTACLSKVKAAPCDVLDVMLRMIRRPILYEGMRFQDLVDVAASIDSDPTSLYLFTEFASLLLSHVEATTQRGRDYLDEAVTHLASKPVVQPGPLKLRELALSSLTAKLSSDRVDKLLMDHKEFLLAQLSVNSPVSKVCVEGIESLGGPKELKKLSKSRRKSDSTLGVAARHSAMSVSTVESRLQLKDGIGKQDQSFQSLAGSDDLAHLLALGHMASSAEDSRDNGIGAAYSTLIDRLVETTSVRRFCLTSEIMEMILRTHPRSVSQWTIDATLSAVARICSKDGPNLASPYASTIFLHLCQLANAIMINHYLKLQGRFHLVAQTLQSLLRCLFIPQPYSTRAVRAYPPPPWLTLQLGASHAAAFARLVTLICDPTVSSVTRSYNNNLTSATDKAKRTAGLHMPFVLATFIKLQLEMDMRPDVRERLIPAVYAIFDTTTIDSRKVLGDTLDASGRAVLTNLTRDYLKFGKWKGN